jgi:hypothetical protein
LLDLSCFCRERLYLPLTSFGEYTSFDREDEEHGAVEGRFKRDGIDIEERDKPLVDNGVFTIMNPFLK